MLPEVKKARLRAEEQKKRKFKGEAHKNKKSKINQGEREEKRKLTLNNHIPTEHARARDVALHEFRRINPGDSSSSTNEVAMSTEANDLPESNN